MIYIIKAGSSSAGAFTPKYKRGARRATFKFRIHENFMTDAPDILRSWDRLFGITMFSDIRAISAEKRFKTGVDLCICKLNGRIMAAMRQVNGCNNENAILKRMCYLEPGQWHYASIDHYKGFLDRWYYSMFILPYGYSDDYAYQLNAIPSLPIIRLQGPKLGGKQTLGHNLSFDIEMVDRDELLEVLARRDEVTLTIN